MIRKYHNHKPQTSLSVCCDLWDKPVAKGTSLHVKTVKIQIGLRIHAVWPESKFPPEETFNPWLSIQCPSKIVNTTITNCIQTRGTTRNSHTTITRHQEDKAKQPPLHQDGCKTRMDTKKKRTTKQKNETIPQLEEQSTTIPHQHNHHLRTDSSLSNWGLKCILLVPKPLPLILFLSKRKNNIKLAWRFPNYCNKTIWST